MESHLPPYHQHLGLTNPLTCINAITAAIYTAAISSPPSQVPTITNAIVTIIKDSTFFIAD